MDLWKTRREPPKESCANSSSTKRVESINGIKLMAVGGWCGQ